MGFLVFLAEKPLVRVGCLSGTGERDSRRSRLHLRISLIGWQVEVRDLSSSNGSVLNLPSGAERRLAPGDSVVIEPGTKISIGHRSIQYQSYRAG